MNTKIIILKDQIKGKIKDLKGDLRVLNKQLKKKEKEKYPASCVIANIKKEIAKTEKYKRNLKRLLNEI